MAAQIRSSILAVVLLAAGCSTQAAESPRPLKPPCVDVPVKHERPRRLYRRRISKPTSKPTKMAGSLAGSPAGAPMRSTQGSARKSKSARGVSGGGGGRARSGGGGRRGRQRGRARRRAVKRKGLVRYLSADDSNSEASPVIVRQTVYAGRYVPPARVRTYEFLNRADFDYPPPPAGDDVVLVPELRATGVPGRYSMQVALRSADRARAEMAPLAVVVLLDVSGSMAGPPIDLARGFVRGLAGRLRPGDRISLVSIAREARTLLEDEPIDGGTAERVGAALAQLSVSDVTNLDKGLRRAYQLAAKTRAEGRLTRVVVVSDGAANAGRRSKRLISKHAKDADRQGIYLMGVGVGAGFDDSLMDTLTDRGRGAYLFLDGPGEVARALEDRRLVGALDVAVKDVRLKLVMPPGWSIEAFHGEQISARRSKVIPQYLGPNDQMLYHLVVSTGEAPEVAGQALFELEAEYRPVGGDRRLARTSRTAAQMLTGSGRVAKGDALVRFAEAFKAVRHPLETHREANLAAWDAATVEVEALAKQLGADPDVGEALGLMRRYRRTLDEGEAGRRACDRDIESPPVVLGIDPRLVEEVVVRSYRPKRAIKALERLRNSDRLLPLQGARFLAIGTGKVGTRWPSQTSELRDLELRDPAPRYLGHKRYWKRREPVWDVAQVALKLRAPPDAKSFSFDFNYFSSEYPEFVNQDFNDTFYAILEAASTNAGATTNIAFDPRRRAIEVDNNYFEGAFHPIPNKGTGFDREGSTGWLRTSWPIEGGEAFTITFSIHDEGDGIYDSLAVLDNFRFHSYPAVGTTDPLN